MNNDEKKELESVKEEKFFNKMAQTASKLSKAGDMIPAHYKGDPYKIFAALMLGDELGLKPMQALRSIFVVNGKPALYGDAQLGLAMNTGELEDIKEFFDNENNAHCIVKRRGYSAVERIYTQEDKKHNANNGNAVWKAHERRMMQMRARAFALRDSFADILSGIYHDTEIDEIRQEKDITPHENAVVLDEFKSTPPQTSPNKVVETTKNLDEAITESLRKTEGIQRTTEEMVGKAVKKEPAKPAKKKETEKFGLNGGE